MQNQPLEKRVELLEKYMLSIGATLKEAAEHGKKTAAVPNMIEGFFKRTEELTIMIAPLYRALDALGEGLLLLDQRQRNMAKYLCNLDVPVSRAIKDDFLAQIAKEETATEKLQHFLSLIRKAREESKLEKPPQNPRGDSPN